MNTSKVRATVLAGFFPWLLLACLLIVTAFVYQPGLSGPLILEDIPNIQNNSALDVESLSVEDLRKAAFSHVSGDGRQPVTMLSLAVGHYFFGDNVYSAKAINLAIHLGNGILVFLLVKLLLQLVWGSKNRRNETDLSGWFAILVAAAWLLHPINLTVVLYVMQRATALSVLFVLMALLAYVKGRLSWNESGKYLALTWFFGAALLFLVGFLSKETALLFPFYLCLLEWLVLAPYFQPRDSNNKSVVTAVMWLVVALVMVWAYVVWGNSVRDSFGGEVSALSQLLLTEARALLFYLGLILLPRPNEFGMFHDNIAISSGLFSPVSTAISLCILLVLFWSMIRVRRRQTLYSFGGFLFLASSFGGTMLMPSELLRDSSNYLGSMGVLLGTVIFIIGFRFAVLSSTTRIMIVSSFCVFFGAITYGQAQAWQSQNRLAMTMVHNHPLSARSNYQAAVVYAEMSLDPSIALDNREEFRQLSVDYFTKSAELKPDDASGLLAVLLLEGAETRSSKKSVIDDLLSGRKNNRKVPLVTDHNALLDIPRRLAEKPLSDLVIQNLLRISRCERYGGCSYGDGKIDLLFEKMLLNPHVEEEPTRKAMLLDEMALRRYSAEDDSGAKDFLEKAIEIDPENGAFKLDMAVILVSSNNIDQALLYINEVLSEQQSEVIKERAETMLQTIQKGNVKN